MVDLCAPALIYVAFSLTQVIIDTFKGLYNTAFFKFIVMIIITILLNSLCQSGMGIISWIIVFIPFIFMSVIVAILLYVFGLDPATGQLNFKCNSPQPTIVSTNNNNNLIYSSTVKLTNPNTVNPTYIDVSYSETPLTNESTEQTQMVSAPVGSSDPQFG